MSARAGRIAVEAAVAAVLTFLISLIVFGPLLDRLDTGWAGGDMLSTYVNTAQWSGFGYGISSQFGFPLGMDLNYFPGIDITENTFAWLVNGLTGSTFLGVNLLVVLSFPLAGALAYLTIRMTGLGGPIAIALAVAFAVIPFHWGRALGHTYLSTLYSAVVGLALVLLIGSGLFTRLPRQGGSRQRALLITAVAVMVVIVAWTGVYYAAFTVILGVAALIWRVAQRAPARTVGIEALPILGVGLLAVIGFIPSLLTLRSDPPLASLGERTAMEAVTYAGNLSMAVLPIPQSSLPRMGYYNEAVLRAFSEAPYSESNVITNFGTWVTAACLIVLISGLIVGSRWSTAVTQPPARVTAGLAAYLMTVTVLFFVPWGLNFLFAEFVTAQIRAWNRLLPMLLLLFMVGAASVLHRTSASRRWAVAIPVAVALLALTAIDSVYPFRGAYGASVAESGSLTQSARAYADRVNAALPQDCGVLQLPYMAYPENGLAADLDDYDHFWTSLTNPGKEWSYGSVKFTDASIWASQLPQTPTDEQLDILRQAGFCAIHLDGRGYASEILPAVAADLTARLGPAVASGLDGAWQLFALGDAGRTVDTARVEAFLHQPFIEIDPVTVSPRETSLRTAWWWSTRPTGTFTLTATDGSHPLREVSGSLRAPACGAVPVTVTVRSIDGEESVLVLADPGESAPFRVRLPTPSDTVEVTVDTPGRGCATEDPERVDFVQVLDLTGE